MAGRRSSWSPLATAPERQPEERPAGGVDLVVDDVAPGLFLVGFGQSLRSDHEEAGGDHRLGVPIEIAAGGEQIAGQLVDGELVVGFVGVERPDDVVPVAPGIAHHCVGIVRGGFRITDHIEPVPAPPGSP